MEALFREKERIAREALERGCDADLAWADRLVNRHVRRARSDLEERILSLETADPTLRCVLTALEADGVAQRCARDVVANADVRFRARFGIYADTLPRPKIRLPHVDIDGDGTVAPRCTPTSTTLDEWIDELNGTLRRALRQAVATACRLVVARGLTSLARARAASYLAVRK